MEIITDKTIFDINNPYPEIHKLNEGSEILIFNDFLKKPDDYKNLLSKIPAFESDYFYPTASPGWSQLIPYEFFLTMESLLSNWVGFNPWVEQSFTNIYKDRMRCNCKAWYPHHDSKDSVLNLWLSDGEGGTAFYTWNNHYQGINLPEHIQDKVFSIKNKYPDRDTARELFTQAKDDINNKTLSNLDRAAAFYVTNKCSFSGLTESSSFSPQASESNFSYRGIDKLAQYGKLIQNWKITNSTYSDLLTDDPTVFMYSDPPYDIKTNLYGKKGAMHKKFDHDVFAADCDDACCDHIISYNSSQLVRDRFINWNASEFDLTYTMRSVGKYMLEQMDRKELVLTNYTI